MHFFLKFLVICVIIETNDAKWLCPPCTWTQSPTQNNCISNFLSKEMCADTMNDLAISRISDTIEITQHSLTPSNPLISKRARESEAAAGLSPNDVTQTEIM